MSKRMKLTIAGVAIAALAGVAAVGASKRGTKATEVKMEAVGRRDLVASVTASGQIIPHTKVDVSADVTGRIVRLAVEEGQMVTKGQFLLQIDPVQSEAAVQRATAAVSSARAQAAQAKANWVQAQATYKRQNDIVKQNPQLVSAQELEQLKTTTEVNEALYEAAQHQVDQAIDYEVTIQLVNAPAETRPDFSATAKVITDTRTKVLSVPIIALTVREDSAIANTDTAPTMGSRQPQKQVGKKDVEGVFIVGADNKVQFKPVKVGIAGEKYFEVVSGLKEGEKIVAGTYQAIRELKDGALVRSAEQAGKDGKSAPKPGAKS